MKISKLLAASLLMTFSVVASAQDLQQANTYLRSSGPTPTLHYAYPFDFEVNTKPLKLVEPLSNDVASALSSDDVEKQDYDFGPEILSLAISTDLLGIYIEYTHLPVIREMTAQLYGELKDTGDYVHAIKNILSLSHDVDHSPKEILQRYENHLKIAGVPTEEIQKSHESLSVKLD